ncbi:MAG: GspE/PulE family protein [Thermodesulfobacteriota bacterium]
MNETEKDQGLSAPGGQQQERHPEEPARPVAGGGDAGGRTAPRTSLKDLPRRRLRKRCKLGQVLLEAGVIDQEALDYALKLGQEKKMKLGQVLIEMGLADDMLVTRSLASQLNVPCVDPNKLAIPPEILSCVPTGLAYKLKAIPLKKSGNKLVVAMEDPTDFNAEDDLRFAAGLNIQPVLASGPDIRKALETYYAKAPDAEAPAAEPPVADDLLVLEEENEKEHDTRELFLSSQRSPIVNLSNTILKEAIRRKASDIHIDPHLDKVLVRYRVDGVLSEYSRLDKDFLAPLVSRMKVISGMDISIRRKPQDGKARVRCDGAFYDLRVSTLPASHGEKVVVRILGQEKGALRLEEMGFSSKAFQNMSEALDKTSGIILVTGPTGSGKSTTLYACLNRLKTPEVNIVTVEDPVEYEMEGVNQIQINPKAGLTFAACLRSILRQDPNIIMVGEIRDPETASIAVQASLTGHLVLSTLHTNDAPATVGRLLDLGVEPFLLASSLEAILAQRLVRRVCPHCARPEKVPRELLSRFQVQQDRWADVPFMSGGGCAHCHFTGYAGRMGIYETLRLTPSIREAVSHSSTIAKIKGLAEKEGYRPMAMDGFEKARAGYTTLSEVFRVAVMDNDDSSNGLMMDTECDPCPLEEDSGSFSREGFASGSYWKKLVAEMEAKQLILEKRLEAREKDLLRQNERIKRLEWMFMGMRAQKEKK